MGPLQKMPAPWVCFILSTADQSIPPYWTNENSAKISSYLKAIVASLVRQWEATDAGAHGIRFYKAVRNAG